MIQGHTNVKAARFGAGAIDGIGKELGRFVVTTMEVPWRLAQPRLGAAPAAVIHVENMEVETLDRQMVAAPQCDTVLAIGGGQAIRIKDQSTSSSSAKAKEDGLGAGARLANIPGMHHRDRDDCHPYREGVASHVLPIPDP